MEERTLKFDRATEFEIIESIDFEEEVAKPESLRFFTLDEQLTDYFDKILPKKKVITKFEYSQIARDVDRLREIYGKIITVTDVDYIVDLSRKEINVSWVKPIYSKLSLVPYSYAEKWSPLFVPPLRTAPNYYTRMLTALPSPYKTTTGLPILRKTRVVDEDGKNELMALGLYERTKGVTHEDGSFTVIPVPIGNTADDIKTIGFYIDAHEVPKPLAEHPFLSGPSSKFITEEPLLRVFPTIEAIMTHGVPKTEFPYTEGSKFLKIYDVKLKDVPWHLWKDTFPPSNTITKTPEILSVKFPDYDRDSKPSKKLLEIYSLPWLEAIEPRLWMSRQEDGGSLISRMLLSKSGNSGLVPPVINEAPQRIITTSTPEECLVLDSFDSFVTSGVYRSPKWDDIESALKKSKPLPAGVCVPTSYIVQERADAIVNNKIAWKEDTDSKILEDHIKLLKLFQYIENVEKLPVYEKFAGHPQSELRRMILAVIKDETRFPVDKGIGIEKLLKGIAPKENVYYFTDDSFLICGHTLAIMRGDLENDETLFYEHWSTVDEGFRVCKSCSERLTDQVFAAVDDFDENGNPIISHDKLETGGIHGDVFANSLRQLASFFQLGNASESIFYLLLSLFQVLPNEDQLLPILQFIRGVRVPLFANAKISKEIKETTDGTIGIAGVVVLLLTHNPFLTPRRFFGSKIIRLSGFPRDTDDEKDCPVLDILLSVLKTTFEATPGTFKGPIAGIIRKILTKTKDVRKDTLSIIKVAYKKFNALFESSKERYVVPLKSEILASISFPLLKVEKTVFSPGEGIGSELLGKCDSEFPSTYLTGILPPSVVQDPVILEKTGPSANSLDINADLHIEESVEISDAKLRERVKLGIPKSFKMDKIASFLASADGIGILSLVNRMLDILIQEKYSLKEASKMRREAIFMKTTINPSILRDAAKGLAYELIHSIDDSIKKSVILRLQRDLVVTMILITKDEATREESDLRTREREVFKQRMRQMDDSQREVTKMMLDIGIAPYIITNEDRELFAKEYNYSDPEAEYDRIIGEQDGDKPEEGYNNVDNLEDGLPMNENVAVDNGDYGTREQIYGRDGDYVAAFDDEGFGV